MAQETDRLGSTGELSVPTTSEAPLVAVTRCPSGISYCHESSKTIEALYMATVESEEGPVTQLAKVSSHEWDSDLTRSAVPILPADSKVYISIPTGEPPRSSTGALQTSSPGQDGSSQRPNGGQQFTNDGIAKPSTLHTENATAQLSGEPTLRVSGTVTGTVTGTATGAGSTQLETTGGPVTVSNSAQRQSLNFLVVGAALIISAFHLLMS